MPKKPKKPKKPCDTTVRWSVRSEGDTEEVRTLLTKLVRALVKTDTRSEVKAETGARSQENGYVSLNAKPNWCWRK